MKSFRMLGIALTALMACSGIARSQTPPFSPGTWTKITTPPAGVRHIQLLTDGSVLAIDSGCSATGKWYRLVPNGHGSYVHGTWQTTVGAMPTGYNPLYFA